MSSPDLTSARSGQFLSDSPLVPLGHPILHCPPKGPPPIYTKGAALHTNTQDLLHTYANHAPLFGLFHIYTQIVQTILPT